MPNSEDDGVDVFHNPDLTQNREVWEAEQRPIEYTGLLGANGRPILRVPMPKPPIGFHNPAYLYDHDPDKDFFYQEAE